MLYTDFIEFITHNVWGIILFNVICGIIGSVLGSFIYKVVLRKYKKGKLKKYLVKAGTYFGGGSRTVYAMNTTSFHQSLLVGDYVIKILLSLSKIGIIGVVTLVLLFVLRAYWISTPIIIGVAGLFCGVEYRRLKDYLKIYDGMFKYVYGDEYFKSEMEGIKQYWDKMTGKKDQEAVNK